MLLGSRPTDQGHQLLEPGVTLEQYMEVEKVVGSQRRARAQLGELGRPLPHLLRRPGRHEEVDEMIVIAASTSRVARSVG